MTLTDIKEFLRENNRVSLGEIAGHFSADKGQIESMLDHWVRKGRVEKVRDELPLPSGSCCCGKCGERQVVVYYRWLDH